MEPTQEDIEREESHVTEQTIGACIEVHRALGPGLLESTYERCLCRELTLRGIPFRRQISLPVEYKGVLIDSGYRIDLLVCDSVVVELKAIEQVLPIHLAQVITYLKLSELRVGLLINFNVTSLKRGIRRLWREY